MHGNLEVLEVFHGTKQFINALEISDVITAVLTKRGVNGVHVDNGGIQTSEVVQVLVYT